MGWQTAYDPTLTSNAGSPGERNYRMTVAADTSSFSGTKIRVTILNGDAFQDSVLDGASIGLMTTADDMDDAANGTFKRITWVDAGGGNGVTVQESSTAVSDEITFDFDKTKRYGIHFYVASVQYWAFELNLDSGGYYNIGGDDTLTQTVSYTGTTHVFLLDKLEVFEEEAVTFIPKVIFIT